MSAVTDTPEAEAATERDRVERDRQNDRIDDESADLILDFLSAINPDDYTVPAGAVGTKSYSTISSYGQNLRMLARRADNPLADLTAADINQHYSDSDLATGTVAQRQSTARVFYRYHEDLGVDPELIVIDKMDPSPVEPRDLFTREEIDAMFDAMDNDRDRAMVSLMLYTGQRVRAIQTLRVGDIDLEESRFYLNTDAAGLKGATGMRPLLVAHGAVSDWMEKHPRSDDPDAYFIGKLPDSSNGSYDNPMWQQSINKRLKQIAREAGIDRPDERGHAHNLRHTFVRWAYVNRDMDVQTIKYMTGHAKDSQTLERTYMNIFEGDFARKAEVAAGTAEPDEEDHLTPEVCPICNYGPLPEGSRACPRCTTVLTPDGAEAREQAEDDIKQSYRQSDPEDEETMEQLDALDAAVERRMSELLDDPAFLERALERAEDGG